MNDPADPVTAVRDDQRARWARGDRRPAEAYFADRPALLADSESALAVLYGEMLERQAAGEPPDPADFRRRFPALAADIDGLWDVFVALETGGPPDPAAGEYDVSDWVAEGSGWRLGRAVGGGGEAVTLLEVRTPDPDGVRRAGRLTAVPGDPHLPVVLADGPTADGAWLALRPACAGPVTATSAGELTHIVRAVAALHAAGVIHGAITSGLLYRAADDGRPVLAGVGLAPGTRGGDVRALREMVSALLPAADSDGELAAALAQLSASLPPERSRGRRPMWLLVAAAALLLILTVLAQGW